MKKLVFISLVIILAIGLTLVGCTKTTSTVAPPPATSSSAPPPVSTSAAPKTLDIGDIWGLTGPDADSHAIMQKGAAMAAKYINDNGGINVAGQKYLINLVTKDTKSTADGAVTGAQELVFQAKVKFVEGLPTPFEVSAVRSITDPNKVFYLGMVEEDPSPDFPYTFSATYPYKWPKQAIYAALMKYYPNVKTVTVLNQDEAGNMSAGAEAIVQIQKLGLTIEGSYNISFQYVRRTTYCDQGCRHEAGRHRYEYGHAHYGRRYC